MLYAFRPWSSHFGEPQLAMKEMKDGKMIKDAPLKNIKADQIVAIGGLTNSLCEAVGAWLQANMGACFDGIRTTIPLASGAADVARALEESLGILGTVTLRERYATNVRAHMDKLMTDQRCILGIRKGNIEWTKLQEGKDAEVITTKVHKETTKFDKWFIRQMLRAVGTICALTEFASQDPDALQGTVLLYHVMIGDHEEEILRQLKTVDYTNADIAKAYTLFPYDLAIHELDDQQNITHPVHVLDMFAYAVVELTTQTTAEGGPSAQLTDATAWVPQQMRRHFKKIVDYMHHKMKGRPTGARRDHEQARQGGRGP